MESSKTLEIPENIKNKYILGIEGSANKIGIGIVDFFGKIYANPR